MLARCAAVFAVLVVSTASAAPPPAPRARAAAGPPPAAAPSRTLTRRTLVLDDAAATTIPELHVARGTATVITFQTDIAEGGVLLGAVERLFWPIQQTPRLAILSPREDLREAVPLIVQLKDGTILTFQCTTLPSDVDAQVDVVLKLRERAPADSAAALRASVAALRGELDECRSTAGDQGTHKLAALLAGEDLSTPQAFDRRRVRGQDRQNRLLVEAKWAYRVLGLTYLVLVVENRDPDRAWVFDHAEVSVVGKKQKTDLRVAAAAVDVASVPPDQAGRVVIAFPSPGTGAMRVSVRLHERDGGRVATLSDVEI